jgi:hypothetical protein
MKKFNSRKPKPAQLEVQWSEPESFALITLLAVDGDRVAKEAARRAADQQASERLQTQFKSQPIQTIDHT